MCDNDVGITYDTRLMNSVCDNDNDVGIACGAWLMKQCGIMIWVLHMMQDL